MVAGIAPEERCVNTSERVNVCDCRELVENAGPEKVLNMQNSYRWYQRFSTFNVKRSENVDQSVMVWRLLQHSTNKFASLNMLMSHLY